MRVTPASSVSFDLLCPDVHLTYMGYQLHTNYLWRVTYQPCVDDEGIVDEEIKGEVVKPTKTHQRMGAGAVAEFKSFEE